MRMSDDPALRDYDDCYIGSILRGEGTAFLVDQGILFAAYDALGHDALDEEVSRTSKIDHWLGSDFDGVIMFGEGDAMQHAAGEESERCAYDNLNAVPHAASVASKAAA
jgi:hypothetical protein